MRRLCCWLAFDYEFVVQLIHAVVEVHVFVVLAVTFQKMLLNYHHHHHLFIFIIIIIIADMLIITIINNFNI